MNKKLSMRRRWFCIGASLTLGAILLNPPIARADSSGPDGLTQQTAAASCWEIKQNDPSAPDGIYWLGTPKLGAPQQFYCDQTTDGGGWVLVGRGREGWSESNMGRGTAAEVRDPITGPSAFLPKQLSSQTIEGLLNGQSVNSLPDGIRLHRATNIAGTTWQNFSFTLASPRDTWTWEFYNQQRVNSYTIDGQKFNVSGSSTYTQSFGADSTYRRLDTTTTSASGWKIGFGYGSNAHGSPDASSYIWGSSTSMSYPRPFTQVYLRPKLMSADIFSAIPDSGTDKVTNRPGVSSFADKTVWGVAGIGAGPTTSEGNNEVAAFAEIGDVVYVGGNFTSVQKTSSGGSKQSQSYLAAFNKQTGEWISTFQPSVNNEVRALAAMPDGRLAIGGYFTQVDGVAKQYLAVINGTTGALDPTFTGGVINHLSGESTIVRSLDVQGDWLYVGGAFTHSVGGTSVGETYTRGAARLEISDGTPDPNWNPELNGSVVSIDASARGDRLYAAGYFTMAQNNTTNKAAALNTTTAAPFSWDVHFSTAVSGAYQQAIKEVGDRIWVGGSEHSLFSYNRDDFSLLSTAVGQRGGDYQAIASDGTTVYGGCHCFDMQYAGANSWPNIGTGWTEAERVFGTSAWDAGSGKIDPDFSPELSTRHGAGSWALMVDSSGTLWIGGDYNYSYRSGFVSQWSGGFVRFAPIDTDPPSTPTNFSGEPAGASEVKLSWTASNGDPTTYEVLRDDRVVASTTSTSITIDSGTAESKYFVRAVDAAGNRSASTKALTVSDSSGNTGTSLITVGSAWHYLYDANGAPDGWKADAFDASSWSTGVAPIGWGQSDLGTTLTTSLSPKPLTSYYRKSFDIEDATQVQSVDITTRADDGVVVYVNGAEVARVNMPSGNPTVSTYATAAVTAASALANPVVVHVPGNLVHDGANVVTAEVHSNYRSTPSHSFELTATATLGTQPAGPLLATGANWSYYSGTSAVPDDWNSASFDDSAWITGEAPIGWGQSDLGTTLTFDGTRPITTYYRRSIDLSAADAAAGLDITTRADDGIVVYVNGAEVGRANMPDGTVTAGTYATSAPTASQALANPVIFHVSASNLGTGKTVIAVEVHSNYRSTPSHSFELSASRAGA